jgi:hypothetical protein
MSRIIPATALKRAHQIATQLKPQQQIRMASTTHHKLNTGASIPAIGFGTWQDKDAQEGAVLTALNAGYSHIDTVCHVLPTLHRVHGTLTISRLVSMAQSQQSAEE